MPAQTTIPALDPLPPVVEAVRAAGVSLLRSDTGSLVGYCPRCERRVPTLFVSERAGWWQCFACGVRGGAADAATRLVRRRVAA